MCKPGAAYMPIDPGDPKGRFTSTWAPLAVVDRAHVDRLPGFLATEARPALGVERRTLWVADPGAIR